MRGGDVVGGNGRRSSGGELRLRRGVCRGGEPLLRHGSPDGTIDGEHPDTGGNSVTGSVSVAIRPGSCSQGAPENRRDVASGRIGSVSRRRRSGPLDVESRSGDADQAGFEEPALPAILFISLSAFGGPCMLPASRKAGRPPPISALFLMGRVPGRYRGF